MTSHCISSIPPKRWLIALLLLANANAPVFAFDGDDKEPKKDVRPGLVPLNKEEQEKVNWAIDCGLDYLRGVQRPEGYWNDGSERVRRHVVAFASLPALALLECGVKPGDDSIQRAAKVVRQGSIALTGTYEISLAILFLDRLGDIGDRELIRSLCLRLAAGQRSLGEWSYECPLLNTAQEKVLLTKLRKAEDALLKVSVDRDTLPPSLLKEPVKSRPKTTHLRSEGDNSNTQFAILALWAARKYDLPLRPTVTAVEIRFRCSQQKNGWGYYCHDKPDNSPSSSMTCVGLLALALGYGWDKEDDKADKFMGKKEDQGIKLGLFALGDRLAKRPPVIIAKGWPKGRLDLYMLWTLERTAVICDVDTIGGWDWYRWGLYYVIPGQLGDGSWSSLHSMESKVISTSWALLFLKRSDLMPGLREHLQKKLMITDPGRDGKGGTPRTSPGEKAIPKTTESTVEKTMGEPGATEIMRQHGTWSNTPWTISLKARSAVSENN